MTIFDNHFHLDPRGLYLEAAKMFAKAGGTHLMLTHLPYDDLPLTTGGDYRAAYGRTLGTADLVREKTKLTVFVAVGPYPVDLLRLDERFGLEAAGAGMAGGVEIAAALAPAGRGAAKDAGCAVVLHTEDPTPDIMEEFGRIADSVGLPRQKVVKHHAPPLVLPNETHGVVPSVLAREDHLREALAKGGAL